MDGEDVSSKYANGTMKYIFLNQQEGSRSNMEKIKKMLSLLLAMAMLAALLPCAAFASETASGTCGKNLTWVLEEDGTLTISGTGKMTDWWLSSNAPWYSSRFLIKAVIIEQGVTSIGNCAFRNCSSITNVTIPNSVSSIGYSVFDGCKSLTNMTIPNSVSSIGSSVFSGCSSLTSVDIPDGVTSIGSSAFYGCSSLTSVDIPTDVTSIGSSAFYGTAYYNDATNWEDEVLYIGNYLIKASTSIFGDYAIKDGTTCIADSAFEGCSNLTDVTIPGSVTSIGGYVFYNCSNLTNVDIPGSVTSMGGYVFYNCSSLTNVDIPGSVTSIGERVFYNCSSLINADISNGVASIGYSAFYGCSSLTSITIPNSVTSIGNLSFYGCNNLKTAGPIGGDYNFELGWSEAIPSGVFKSCSSLTSVTILDGVTSIGGSAFFNCSSLTSITIPNSITSIGDSAFKDCSSLTDIYYAGSKEEWSKISIGKDNECAMLAAIHCSDGDAKTIIAQGNCGSEAVWRIENDGTLTISGTGKMKNYYSYSGLPWYSKSNAIKTVVIEDGITNIGRCAFGGCSNLTSVTIPESVTYIEKDAFADCNSLTDVYYGGSKYYWNAIPVYGGNDRLTEAAIHCSDGDAVLISWTIDSDGKLTISGIGQMCDYVYSDFSSYDAPWYSERYNIKTAVIEDGITGIGNNAFSGCGSLASITIPKSVTDIGEYSFSGCNSLKDIYYAGSREEWSKISIGKNNECALLAAIHCNDGDVKTVIDSGTWFNDGTWTFESGYVMTISGAGKIFYGSWNSRENSVKKVVIEDGVTSIGDNVFGSFKNLNSITIADSVTSIGENSFLDRAVTICAHEGSYAQKYAENNGIKFESLGKMDIESCYVTNVDELIGAIASNREIILADGTYVLVGTDYNDSFQSNVDTLRISNVNYLTIKAEHAGMAEIISSDVNSGEYSQPTIAFDNCYEIKLE